jgi:RHS repeat-associated protein
MTLPNGISTAYSYDAAGRLTGMKYSKGSTILRDLSYGYDEINRRTSYSGNTAPEPQETATNTATVDASNRYTSLNGKPVAHDENGNQTINNAVWDARDRLVSLSGPNFTAAFTYDAMGRRTSKTVNGQTKTYHYDGSDLISETGADYTFGPGIDQPLERKSGQNEYYLSDVLGSVIGLADGTGAIKTSYNYSPFGKKQTTGVASGNPFAFTGREDDGTGYYYYRARYYSPDQKRFISEDPLGFGGGDTNLQAYVGNSPTNFTDPSGNAPLKGPASKEPVITRGSPAWRRAVKELETPSRITINLRVKDIVDAELLLNTAKPGIPVYGPGGIGTFPGYYNGEKYKYGYEIHPNEQFHTDAEFNDLPHLKFRDYPAGGKNGNDGHIFFGFSDDDRCPQEIKEKERPWENPFNWIPKFSIPPLPSFPRRGREWSY